MTTENENELFLTLPQIVQGWAVSPKTVRRWELPTVGKDGKFDLYKLSDIVENRKKAPGNFDYERTRKEKELADKLEMQNEEFRKSLISVEDVERIWGDIADNVKSKMLGITSQVSKILAQNSTTTIPFEDVKRIENAIDGQIKSALSELSRTRA